MPKPKIWGQNYKKFDPTIDGSVCLNNSIGLYAVSQNIKIHEVLFDSLFWKKNNQLLTKTNGTNQFKITQSGIYTVIGKQGTCETESDPVQIKIGEPTTANISGSTSIYAGQKANLNLNFTGGNAWSYQTSDIGTTQNTTLSPTIKSVSPTVTTTYTLNSIASNCGVGTVSGLAKITVCNVGQSVSLQSGDWNVPSTWACGQIPTPTLNAIIDQGHTISLPNGYQGNVKKLELKGGITQGVGASLRVSN